MSVKELIVLLAQQDPDARVVMSKDAEGNDFSPISSITPGVYTARTTWYGEFDASPTHCAPGAVCLWPVG